MHAVKFASLISAGFALAPFGTLAAGESPSERVDALFAKWDKSNSPGCSVAVAQDGEILYKRGYGMADLDHGIANTPATVFHIASISKQFAAASVALLAQEGKLSLDDPVRKYVPELPDFGTPITIRQLVHHTSGLRDQWELLGFSGWRYSKDLITDADVMSLVKRQRALNFKPGAKYSYSNTGYTLLAQITQRVSGKSFREFTTERFFRPLGMDATHFRDDHAEIVPNIAYGYEREDGTFKLSVTNFDTVGATSLLATVEDFAKWNQNLVDGKVGGPALLRQMVERGVLNDGKQIAYAFGLSVGTYRGLPTVGHSGSDAGYRAYSVRFPEQRFAVTCLCNIGEAMPTVIGQKIADIYLEGQLQPAPAPAPIVAMTEPEMAPLTGMYVSRDGRSAQRVFVREGALQMTGSEEDHASTLLPVGDNRFRIGERGEGAEFAGTPLRLTLTSEWDDPETYERTAAYEPGQQALAQYAGTYTSEEIELPYRIAVVGGELELTHMKLVKGEPLKPMVRDLFSGGDLGTLRFRRDSRGRVSGFDINTGRIVDFRFTRRAKD